MTHTNFETGASTHAVNDLILFTDNTPVLAKLRDAIYNDITEAGYFGTGAKYLRFMPLFEAARKHYIHEFKNRGAGHIIRMTYEEISEYCQLFINDLDNWKSENKK